MTFLNRLSFSGRDCYTQCGLKYYYQYVKRLKIQEDKDTSPLEFGSYIHEIFEHGVGKDLDHLVELSNQLKPKYKFNKSYDSKIPRCLANFLELNKKLTETLSEEWCYEIVMCEKGNINHNGIVDRIVKGKEGGLLVIDYKTGKKEKSRVELYQDKQLMGYVLAASREYKVPIDKIRAAHFYPISGKLVDVKYNNTQISKFIREFINDAWEIRKKKADEFVPTRNQYCNWCKFQRVCPKFNDSRTVTKRLDELKKPQ